MALDPFAALSQRNRSRQQQYLLPEEEESILAQLGQGTLGGLSYVGSTLDKPGRAVRGVLSGLTGGDWGGGLLNLVPFSDTMGLTDSEGVTGRDLLEGWGVLDANQSGFDAGDVAGFAADVLLDPTTYLTFGTSALTPLGKAAQHAGTLAKASRGVDDVLTMGAREAGLRSGQRGLVGVGLPFMEPVAALGTGEAAAQVARGLDFAGEALRYGDLGDIPLVGNLLPEPLADFSPGRQMAAAFSKDVKGTYTKPAQIAAQAMSEAERVAGEEAAGLGIEAYQQLKQAGLGPDAYFDELTQAVEGLPVQPGIIGDVAAQMKGQVDQAWQGLKATGQYRPDLELENIGYFPRYAAESVAGDRNRAKIFQMDADSMLHRDELLKDVPADTINRLSRGETVPGVSEDLAARFAEPAGRNFYQDPIQSFARYERQIKQATEASNGAMEFLTKHVTAQGPDTVPLMDVLGKAKFVGPDGVTPEALARLQQAGIMDVASAHVPADIAADVSRLIKGFSSPEATAPILQVYDWFTSAFKTSVTTPFPSFHTRNMLTGAWQNLVGGALDPSSYSAAYKLMKGEAVEGAIQHPLVQKAIAKGKAIIDDQQASDFLRGEMYARNVVGQSFTNEIAGRFVNPAENFAGNIMGEVGNELGIGSIPTAAKEGFQSAEGSNSIVRGLKGVVGGAVSAGVKTGNMVEGLNRAAGFLALTKQGFEPSVAAAKTRALHVDYGSLSEFERKWMRRLVPFYAFSRGMIPEVVKELIERPGGLTGQAAQLAGAVRDGQDAFLPEYLQGGLGISLSGENAQGMQRFLTNVDLPVETAFEMLHTGPGAVSQTGMDLLGQLNPLVKAPLELATGKQFFTGRDLRDLYSPTGMPIVDQVISNSPLARAASTTRTLVDDRKGLGIKALNTLTGLRVSDVDIDKHRSIAARELIEESLRGGEGVRLFEHMYVTPEGMAQLTPEEQQLYGLYRTLSAKAQKAAREKKKEKRIGYQVAG